MAALQYSEQGVELLVAVYLSDETPASLHVCYTVCERTRNYYADIFTENNYVGSLYIVGAVSHVLRHMTAISLLA